MWPMVHLGGMMSVVWKGHHRSYSRSEEVPILRTTALTISPDEGWARERHGIEKEVSPRSDEDGKASDDWD